MYSAYVEVDSAKTALYQVREDIDTFHKKLYATAVALAETINASLPSIPCRCARQTFRSNVPALTPEDYYRRDLTVPFLDEMIAHINSRFSEIQKKAMMALSLVPSVLISPEHGKARRTLHTSLPSSTRTTSPIHQHFNKSYTYGSVSGRASQLSDLRRFQSLFSMLMRLCFKHPPIVANCLYLASHQL